MYTVVMCMQVIVALPIVVSVVNGISAKTAPYIWSSKSKLIVQSAIHNLFRYDIICVLGIN